MRLTRLVLDTSAVLSGVGTPPGAELYAPSAVADELQEGGRTGRAFSYLIAAGLRVLDPTPDSLERAREAALATGDLPRLSATDLEVLALGMDLSAELVTDDYRIQNVARTLDLPYRGSAQAGITEIRRYVYRCRGCKKEYAEPQKDCGVCGSEVGIARPR